MTYLVACSSLELGLEELEEFAAPAFDARLPGFWRAQLAPVEGLPPSLCAGTWHPTPAVELALDLAGAGICPEPTIEHARLYRKHARYPSNLYATLRETRDVGCPALPEPVHGIVRRALKVTYTVALG